MRFLATCAVLGSLATAGFAQNQPNTILVLDGSGSMWGQIDGTAKIGIAQEVVSGLLSDFPADQGLGLTVYGHRERGNCTDIETIVAPAPGTAAQISDAVNGIKPLGKTPMTDAVIAAAEALRYTEDAATVILVSDGVETCNPDPCAAARLLEEAGIDFTAHVIGFDVEDDPAALAQMQCLADETGGQFLTAANASELDLAITAVVQAPPPEPEPILVEMTFSAVIGEAKTVIETPVLWSITGNDGPVASDEAGNPLPYALEEGAYTATAYSIADEETGEVNFIAIEGGNTLVEVVFEEKLPTATVTAPAEAAAGDTIEVGWKGPAEKNDFIGIRAPDATGYHRFVNTSSLGDTATVSLQMPSKPGAYLIEYILNSERIPLAEAAITVTPVEAAVIAPAQATAGDTIEVGWKGPDYRNDFIAIRAPDAEGYHRFANTVATGKGNPAQLLMPTEPGTYVIEYIEAQDRSPLAAQEIEVVAVAAKVIAPATAAAGATIDVGWDGPAYRNDFIAVRAPDATGYHRFVNTVGVDRGNPAKLVMPTEPGDYVIEYIVSQDRAPIAAQTITIEAVSAKVIAPESASAGATIDVGWTGPGYKNDFIAVRAPDTEGYHRFINTIAADRGNPAKLLMPTEPGRYLIEYIESQDRTAMAVQEIEIVAVEGKVIAPTTAPAGSTVDVGWTGPAYRNDFIAVRAPDATGYHRFINTVGADKGNPAKLLMPAAPGTYLIEYIVNQDRSPLAVQEITLSPVTASLIVPPSGAVGEKITVGWKGPGYRNDFIAIRTPDATGYHRFATTQRLGDEPTVQVSLPDEPGTYVVEYIINQSREPLAAANIEVK